MFRNSRRVLKMIASNYHYQYSFIIYQVLKSRLNKHKNLYVYTKFYNKNYLKKYIKT